MTLGGGAGGRQPLQQQQQHLQQPQQQHVRPASLGLTALMSSCQLNNELEVKALLQRKPSLTAARDRSGKTALHYCAENLTVGCAELLLLYEPGLTSVQDEEGYTTLHFAVISGNRTMVRFLVERGADVNCVDNEKHSCVHWATVCGELECMDILVSAGANPSTADIHGAYPIHYAAQMCGPNSEMGNDVRVGLAALRRLIELGVDVSVRDQDGRPPLLWAASVETRPSKTYCPSGSSDAILALVNAGADVGATDKDGLTALHCAASRGHVDCLETLVSLCGADVDAVDSNGCSALFYAVTLGHADCTQLLLKYGAAPNRQDHKGRTPAHCGAAKGQLETLKILWQHGANLYMRNQRGDLPLHEAVQSGRKDLVQWLLELQPSAVSSPNNNGRCALHVAAMANSVEMCKVLMDRGAEVNPVMRNSKGQLLTPLDASLQRGNRGCAKYLRLHGALPFCKMTDRHDIDRWLEHSFSINKLHKTEQLCDSEAPPAEAAAQGGEMQLLDVKHVQTLESSVQTDSGYFESREYGAANTERLLGDVEAVTKQGTFIEGGRTLKQAIITNVYVRTSGGARVHQPRRKRGGGSKGKGGDMAEGSEETEEYSSSGEDRRAEKREASQRRGGPQEDQAAHKESRKKQVELDSSTTHRVVDEVIVKKRDGMEGHIIKRITRRPSGGEGEEVRVSGEVRDNVETTPEGFTSVTFSERKSSETGRASSEEDTRARLLGKESSAARTLGQVPEGASRPEMKSPAVIRAAERFLAILSARRSKLQAQDSLREHTVKETSETAAVEETTVRLERKAETTNVEEKARKEKAARFQDKVKQTVKHVRPSPKERSSSSGRSSSEKVCEEEIIEKRATELSVVEVLETKVADEISRQADDKTKVSSKKKAGRKQPAKERLSDQEYEDGGRPKKAESGRPPGDRARRERRDSSDSVQSGASAEGVQESLRSSLETVSVTKETSRMHRFEEEVSSEETTEKTRKEEVIERTSEITVEGGEPVATAEFTPSESLQKTDSVTEEEGIEKGRLSSTVAEAIVDLYSRVQRSSPGDKSASGLEKQPSPSSRRASPEGIRTEDTSLKEASKETEETSKDEDQESRMDASSIPPLVAEAVSDLFAQVKQLASTSTSPKERPPSTRDSACSPVLDPEKVERACGSDDIGLVDAACSTRHSSVELAEKGVSPDEEEYTAEAACSTVAEETESVACSPAVQKVDASCSPAESIDQPVEDATCSPISTDVGKGRERADASCSPILELAEETPEMIDAVCSPGLEHAEKTDAASSPADITTTVDAQSSPVDVTADQKESASSPFFALIRQDEQISPMIVEVHDKETWTGSAEDMTADASCTPLMSEKTPDRAEPIEKTDSATSPMDQQPTRDSECSPIVVDLGRETRDVACSPLESGIPAEERDVVNTAVSPIRISDEMSDKATSPPETLTTVHTGISPFPMTPGVEQASSPHKAYTKDAYSSPLEQSAQDLGRAEPMIAAEKPAMADVCLGTSPDEPKISKVEFADASCSPIAFEYSRLSRSSSGSTEVDIAVRSSSIEEATKTPMTDIAAIPAFAETGTSPIGEVRTVTESDSAGIQAEPTIADSGTSPLASLAKTRGTSTEGKEAELALSDSCTSPLDSVALARSAATRDAANSPIATTDTIAVGKRTLKDVVWLRKPGPLRKTKSWDAMGYGSLDDVRSRELLFPDIKHPTRAAQWITPSSGLASPVEAGGANVDKLKLEDTLQLQKLPSIIKTASTPPDTAIAGQQGADSKRGSPSSIPDERDKKSVSLQPVGIKRHSLTQSEHDRSPESSVRSSDYTATTLKDSGFSDVEKHATGISSAEEDDGVDRQGVLSDSAAQELELQRRRLLHSRRKMREGEDEEASPGRDDTDGSAAEDSTRARRPVSEERRPEAEAREGPRKTKSKANGRGDSGKGQRRRRGQPELRPLSERTKVSEDLTMTVQESLRKYRVERQLFSELQELKRHQIRSGRTHENVLVKRLVDRFRELVLAPGMRDFSGPYTFRNYERYLYGQLRDLSTSNDGKVPAKYRKREDEEDEYESGAVSDGPLECVSRAYGRSRPADDYGVGTGAAGEAEVSEHVEPENIARLSNAAMTSGEEAGTATGTMAPSQKTRHIQPSQPVGRKNLLPAILPSPLTSMFTVVRGAPPLPAARAGYGHVRSRVFPQRPAQKVNLTEPDRSPKKTVRARKEASTSTSEVLSNQASRLRAERIRKQREEEERVRRRREEMSSRATAEVTSRLHGSVQNLRRISEEESLERAAATDGALSEQEGPPGRKKYRSTSLTRDAGRRSDHEARKTAAASAVRETPATRTSTKDKKLAPMDKPYTKSQETAQTTADASKPVFPYLKKREGRLSVARVQESRESETSTITKSHQASVQDRRTTSQTAQKTAEVSSSEPYDSHYAARPTEPVTPRRPFSKAREATAATPKESSALLPFWVPHDAARRDVLAKEQEQQPRSKVRDSMGEQQAVRFKDWIKARQRSGATSVGRASTTTTEASTEALAREVRLREGDSSETDSGHEGDGILPDDQRVKEVLLERVSRSLRKNVLPQDVVTMRLKPSPPTAVADQIEAITRTVRMSEFLEAARRDIVVNCIQLRPDNVSEGSPPSSPEEVPSPAASSGDGGSMSDGGAVEDGDGVLEFEIRHGREKNVFWLPTNKIRDNKKWQVTFIVARTDRE
ncbi:hypothetical protein V5799_015559 [Amblyomma americanum]|uniref:Ankyrin n=1 Tax=Amblyomma americanum TaxID=6943 RepID=A0AAQ4F7G7_AMBAM